MHCSSVCVYVCIEREREREEERANLSKLSVQLHAGPQLTRTHTVWLVVFVGVVKPPELLRIPYQFLVAQFLPRTKGFEDEIICETQISQRKRLLFACPTPSIQTSMFTHIGGKLNTTQFLGDLQRVCHC